MTDQLDTVEPNAHEGRDRILERRRIPLHVPVDIRSISLVLIAAIATLYAMQWAKEVLVPILLGLMMSYALAPVVNRLHRWRIPRAIGAGAVLLAITVAAGWGTVSLSGEADALADTLGQMTERVQSLVAHASPSSTSTLAKVEAAASALEKAADSQALNPPLPQAVPQVAAEQTPVRKVDPPRRVAPAPAPQVILAQPRLDLRAYLLTGTLGVLAFLGQVAVVLFVALFLLTSGPSFRRKMVKLAGPKLSQKRVTIETLDEITAQIQRYLMVQVAVSVLVGVATWITFLAIGMNQSAVWGVVAGVTNLIPYLGAVLVGASSGAIALVQFGSIDMALLAGGSSFLIHTLIGNLLTPWWMGQASRMSPFAVFVAVLVFGWLWGVVGLLLGPPMLMVVKAICDRIEDLQPVGELLSG
jgi:predicted PurR-regulated permease PerM